MRNKSKKIVLSVFDYTTIMVQPWADAGFPCICVDIQHPFGITTEGNITKIGVDVFDWLPPRDEVAIAFFFPPCTDVAISGSRWFKDKGLGALIKALQLFDISVKFAEWIGAPYMIENPVNTVSTYWRKPDHIFHPWEYGDKYTKKTYLWTGNGFIMPERRVTEMPEGTDTNWIQNMPDTKDQSNLRSRTPPGFADAVFWTHIIEWYVGF